MEISVELVVAVLGVVTGILGWLGKKKWEKITEKLYKCVKENVDKPPTGETDTDEKKRARKKVWENVETLAEITGAKKKLEKTGNRIINKIFKIK